MISEVKAFKTSRGLMFNTEAEAICHEIAHVLCDAINVPPAVERVLENLPALLPMLVRYNRLTGSRYAPIEALTFRELK